MKLKIVLRNPDGSKPQYSNSELPNVVWTITNLENNTVTDTPMTYHRFKRDCLEYSYVIPFFDHQIQCSINGVELIGSPLKMELASVAENLFCSFCEAVAVQAHLSTPYQRSNTVYYGLCSQHIASLKTNSSCSQWNKTPQKCNLGK
jgi:hypothetical protein